mgnify:CR=1 FL=1
MRNTNICTIFVIQNQRYMKRLNNKEKDLIEAIRNFRKARGWIENENEFRWLIYRTVEELMYDE